MELDRLIAFYHALSPETVARFPEFYTADAWFKDPFNEVRGVDAIQRIFSHMFHQVDDPRFIVTEQVADARGAVLIWEFRFRVQRWGGGATQLMRGASHLKFAADGRIHHHRDYWDTAEELYMKIPLLGGLMRVLRRRFAA